MKKLFYIYFLILVACSKPADNNHKIRIEVDREDEVQIHDVFTAIEIRPLEKTTQSFIINADKTIFQEEKYFILDKEQSAILVFNDVGEFLFKIHKVGKGPGEYNILYDFNINPYTQNIELLTPDGKIFVYSLTGEYIETVKLPSVIRSVNFFENVSDDIVVLYSIFENKRLTYYSRSKNKIVKTEHEVPSFVSRKTPLNFINSPFFKNGDQVCLYETFSNDVYTVTDRGIKHRYSWDFGQHNLNVHDLPQNQSREYYRKIVDASSNYATCFMFNNETVDDIYTMFLYQGTWVTLIYNKKTETYRIFKQFTEVTKCPPLSINKTGVYSVISPLNIDVVLNAKMLDDENKKRLEALEVSDNPILIKFSL